MALTSKKTFNENSLQEKYLKLEEKFTLLMVKAKSYKQKYEKSQELIKTFKDKVPEIDQAEVIKKLEIELLACRTFISNHKDRVKSVIMIMKDPTQDSHQTAIRVANILNPLV